MILYFIKVALLMTVLLIIYKLFLSKINTFKFNRFYLLFSLMLSLVVPLIVLPTIFPETQKVHAQLERIFEFEEKGNTSTINEDPSVTSPSSNYIENDGKISIHSKSESNLNYATIFLSIYIIGVIFIGIVFFSKLIGFFKLVNSSAKENKGDFSYVLIEKETLPFVFLNYFFINKEVFKSNQVEKEIYIHELTHIKQKHSLDILFVEFLKIIFWFNPIIWSYKKAIQLNHEYLADQAVNNTYGNKTAYQLLLLSKITNKSESFTLSSTFNYSITKKRLQMMAEQTQQAKSILLKGSAMTCSFLILLVFGSSFQNIQTSPSLSLNSSVEEYEKLISSALDEDDPYTLVLEKLDLAHLKEVYNALNEEEKLAVSEFPFLTQEAYPKLVELQEKSEKIKVTFKFSTPPAKKTIREDVWENWKKEKNTSFEIDDKMVQVSLDDYSKDDFALNQVEMIEGKKNKTEYLIKLTTHEYYEIKHIKVKKVLNHIIAEYQNEDKLDIMYFMKGVNKKATSKKENLEEIILEGILTHEKKEYKSGPHYHEGVFIPASLTTKNEKWKSVNIFKQLDPKF